MVASDLDKGVTFGDADGPDTFIPQLGIIVPTFTDPRNDLIRGVGKHFKRVSHHIPFKMRGFFKLSDWPEEYRNQLSLDGIDTKVTEEGFVICGGTSYWGRGLGKNKPAEQGRPCRSKAVNRTRYCRAHGGGLHPLDKKMSAKSIIAPPENRVKALDRPQKFLQGFLDISDLTDEEVQGLFIYNDAGQKVDSIALGVKMHGQIAQELHRRMNRFLQTKTASMLNVMVDIAESELVEPADRIKAATWVAERVLGKTPEVIMHGKVEAPYEAIFETIDAGSRSAYRQQSQTGELDMGSDRRAGGSNGEVLDVEFHSFEEESSETEFEGEISDEDGTGENPVETQVGQEVNGTLQAVQEIKKEKEEIDRARELKKARAKAKQRRFAARAVGATTVHDMPWAVQWKFLDSGQFQMKLVCPDDLNENRIAKIEQSNAEAFALAEQWRSDHVA